MVRENKLNRFWMQHNIEAFQHYFENLNDHPQLANISIQ